MRKIGDDPRVMRIVLDDQQHGIARLDPGTVVRDVLLRDLGGAHGAHAVTRGADRRQRALFDSRADIVERQIERKGAPAAWRAAQLDLAAEQVGELAADGEAETGTAIFPARAGIRLLERLETDLLLLERDANAGVG